jgi:hypothetical protein
VVRKVALEERIDTGENRLLQIPPRVREVQLEVVDAHHEQRAYRDRLPPEFPVLQRFVDDAVLFRVRWIVATV